MRRPAAMLVSPASTISSASRVHCLRLGGGDPLHIGARGFALQRGFVDVGRDDAGGGDADLREQRQPAWAGGGEDEDQRGLRAHGGQAYCGPGPPRPGMKR